MVSLESIHQQFAIAPDVFCVGENIIQLMLPIPSYLFQFVSPNVLEFQLELTSDATAAAAGTTGDAAIAAKFEVTRCPK